MRRIARVCLALGASVAVLGVLGVALGLRPSALPPALLDIAAFKLVFIAAGGLIIAGAMLGRAARGRRDEQDSLLAPSPAGQSLPSGAADVSSTAPEPVPVPVHRHDRREP